MNTEDLQRLLTEAQSTLNPVEAGQKLRLVVKEARNIVQSNGGSSEAGRIIFQARSLIIREEVNWEKRAAGWTRMIEELRILADDNKDAEFADMFCQVVTDAIQDIADVRRHAEFFGWMSSSLQLVDKVIAAKPASARLNSLLLARKASVLRHRAQLQETRKLARSDAEAAERTSVRARDLDTSVETLIEFALSSWTLARFQQIESTYRSILTDCETALTSPICKDDVAAILTLARLFRLTFRHELALKTFERALATKQRPRLVLRQSYIYAEAALGLASQASPNYEEYLHSANELLEKASASSLLTLRNRVALAHVKSLLFGQVEMDAIVDQLSALRNQTAAEAIHNWHEVRLAGEDITSALIIGIADGAVLNRLGTIEVEVFGDREAAEALYRTALTFAPRNAVAMTNLARILVENGTEAALEEAHRILQTVEAISDLRFNWWRHVLSDLRERRGFAFSPEGEGKKDREFRRGELGRIENAKSLPELRKMFEVVSLDTDRQRRGFNLERVFNRLGDLSLGTKSYPSYRIKQQGYSLQLDGFLVENNQRYRVECKWRRQPVTQQDVVAFFDKLDVAGVSGIMVSMGGFKKQAIARIRNYARKKVILAINGDEISKIMNGELYLDDVIRRKRHEMDMKTNVFFFF